MIGVKLSRSVGDEVKKKLGLEFNARLSFIWGVSYPLPDWYDSLTDLQKFSWFLYRHFGDLMTFLLFTSNLTMVVTNYHDIRVFTTCTGTLAYIVCVFVKLVTFRRKSKILTKVLDSIHKISENLDRNPLRDEGFFDLHNSYYHHVKFFGMNKIFAVASGVCALAIFEMIHGFFQEKPEDRRLPMAGWFPYDPYVNPQHSVSCVFQLVSYLSFLLKDVAVDLIFLAVLVVVNTQLIYMKRLLGLIVKKGENEFDSLWTDLGDDDESLRRLLGWWVKQHQQITQTIEDFKKISNPYLFTKYLSVSIILFLGGVLVTSSVEYDLVQQTIVLAINLSNLLQLYIFSIMGDFICDNGKKLADEGFHVLLFSRTKEFQKDFHYILARTSKPILITFGDINPLSSYSFGQIVKMTFSYFITIVQIRAKEGNY